MDPVKHSALETKFTEKKNTDNQILNSFLYVINIFNFVHTQYFLRRKR